MKITVDLTPEEFMKLTGIEQLHEFQKQFLQMFTTNLVKSQQSWMETLLYPKSGGTGGDVSR